MKAENSRVLSQGLVSGLIGYGAVVLLILVTDLLAGRPAFFTPALLGSFLFYGVHDPSQVSIWAGPVLSYNGLHLLIFLAFGVAAALLAEFSEHGPQFWYVGLMILLVIVFHMLGLALPIMAMMHGGLSPWLAFGAGLVAAAAMMIYLLAVHPRLREEMRGYREQT